MSLSNVKPQEDAAGRLVAALAQVVVPEPMAPARSDRLRRELADRARRSALAHRDVSTVRREDGAWVALTATVQQRTLIAVHGTRSDLLKVAPHAVIPWPADALAQEFLVLEGELAVETAEAPTVNLSRLNLVVLGAQASLRLAAGSRGATVYVRRPTVPIQQLPVHEARWWQAASAAPVGSACLPCPWSPFLPGVEAAALFAHGGVVSMLIKVSPGAALLDHGHTLDEDCLMLEGDMFLGDVLLRAGDYQLAPVGCRHVGVCSEAGGLFYFHGALAPAASERAR